MTNFPDAKGAYIPEDYHPEGGQPEILEKRNHVDSILKGLDYNLARLREVGVIGENVEIKDLAPMVCCMVDIAYEGCREEVDKISEMVLEDYRRLFNYAGILFPTIADDWTINRRSEAVARLGHRVDVTDALGGERAMIAFEDFLRDKYKATDTDKFYHLDKGPGDNVFLNRLRQLRSGSNHTDAWEYIGVGDRLHYWIDGILRKHVRGGAGNQEVFQRNFVENLSSVLRRKMLSDRKAKNENQQWFGGNDFYDLNVIYELLNDPDSLRAFVGFSSEDYSISRSQEFVADQKDYLNLGIYLGFIKYFRDLGQENPTEWLARMKDYMDFVKKNIHARKKLLEVNIPKNHADRSYEAIMAAHNAMIWLCPNYDGSQFDLENCTEEEMTEFLKYLYEQHLEMELRLDAVRDKDDLTVADIRQLFNIDIDSGPEDILRFVFNDDFVESVIYYGEVSDGINYFENNTGRAERSIIDLNQLDSDVVLNCPTGFMKGYFSEMPDMMLDPQSGERQEFNYITSVKGDSQQDNESFRRDIEGNLLLLAPGGLLQIDGIVESLTRIIRLDIIESILDELGDGYKAWVLFSGNRPVQLTVQRAHPNGYLSDIEMREIHPDYDVVDLKAAMHVPFIEVSNGVRSILVAMGEETYAYIQDDIEVGIKYGYVRVMLDRLLTQDNLENAEIWDDLNLLFFIQYLIELVVLSLNTEEIKDLIKVFHLKNFGGLAPKDYKSKVAGNSYYDRDNVNMEDPIVWLTSVVDHIYCLICLKNGGVDIDDLFSENTDLLSSRQQKLLILIKSAFESAYSKCAKDASAKPESYRELLIRFIDEIKRSYEELDDVNEKLICMYFQKALEEFSEVPFSQDDNIALIIANFHFARLHKIEMRIDENHVDSIVKSIMITVLDEAQEAHTEDVDPSKSQGRVKLLDGLGIQEAISRILKILGVLNDANPQQQYDPDYIHTFPRVGETSRSVPDELNRGLKFPKSDIPNNADVVPVSEVEITQLQREFDAVRESTGLEKPIFFLNFVDCVTNRSFLDRFKQFGLETTTS
jgi:hypothetical protein